MTTFSQHQVLVSGLGFPESLRWADGALWYADWSAGAVYRLDADLTPRVVARRASFPLCFDLLATADGLRPLLVSTPDRAVLLSSGADEEPQPGFRLVEQVSGDAAAEHASRADEEDGLGHWAVPFVSVTLI